MRRSLLSILLLCGSSAFLAAQSHLQQGTVVRMRMTDCIAAQHGFMAAMSGSAQVQAVGLCPEYVLVGDKVVYVILGKGSNQLIPLAEITKFRLLKNELLIRVDDARKESHFQIKAMILRPEWERNPALAADEMTDAARHRLNVDGEEQ